MQKTLVMLFMAMGFQFWPMFAFSGAIEKTSKYSVWYIPIERNFVTPTLSSNIANRTTKKIMLSNSLIDELFKAIERDQQLKIIGDPMIDIRVKIERHSDQRAIFINKKKQVVANGNAILVDDSLVKRTIDFLKMYPKSK